MAFEKKNKGWNQRRSGVREKTPSLREKPNKESSQKETFSFFFEGKRTAKRSKPLGKKREEQETKKKVFIPFKKKKLNSCVQMRGLIV